MNDRAEPILSTLELHCRRLVPMIGWYRELLGAEVLHRDEIQCWLRAPQGWTLMLLGTQFGARPREVAGIDGLALQYHSFEAFAAAYCAHKARNLYPERALKNGIATWLVYRDPDGNRVVLRHLVPGGRTADGLINPLGDDFDPALILDPAPSESTLDTGP